MILQKLIPSSLEKRILSKIKAELKKQRQKVEDKIPKINFKPEHIANTKLLVDREELLKLLPKGGVVVELGVDHGDFSKAILEHNQPAKLHLVDYWGSTRYNQQKRKDVEDMFSDKIEKGEMEINIGLSLEVSKGFPENYFDWVYIDTGHEYELTIEELEEYMTKLKPGGVLAGHDFTRWNRLGFSRFGVVEAVSEFCVKYNWELIYLTMEVNENQSFAIRKIG